MPEGWHCSTHRLPQSLPLHFSSASYGAFALSSAFKPQLKLGKPSGFQT